MRGKYLDIFWIMLPEHLRYATWGTRTGLSACVNRVKPKLSLHYNKGDEFKKYLLEQHMIGEYMNKIWAINTNTNYVLGGYKSRYK